VSRGIDVNLRGSGGICALSEACSRDRGAPLVSMLLEAGADPNNCQSLNRIYYFNWNDNTKSVTRSLLEYGADPNAQDSEGKTPLMSSAEYSCVEAVEMILKHGGNPEIRNNKNGTAISSAMSAIRHPWFFVDGANYDKIVIILLEHCLTPKTF